MQRTSSINEAWPSCPEHIGRDASEAINTKVPNRGWMSLLLPGARRGHEIRVVWVDPMTVTQLPSA